MGLYNAMEKIVANIFQEFEKQYTLKCNCTNCKEDILAIVLNKLPPRYIATQKGELFVKSLYSLNQQLQSDVMKELMRASLIVELNQHHEHNRERAQ